ncbi:dephospho-CoA kinase [Flavobacterium sp. MK4S-17]|uniref:dephospho-CoA kinase n=1 Tax=Flavobacterium sp. MK4S-17 TaxID=2543737 RepID=UPI0013574CCD|nr:dephospho-CoA kinase [Flavobacterium sp. MK4S-17]
MKTRVIGLTGGIGSGKSTMAKYFASLGVPVYIADDEAKKILLEPQTVKEIAEVFGDEVMVNGLPDRKKLAAVVFNSPEKLSVLNSIIHPKVREDFRKWVDNHSNEKFVIKEAAILFESGSYKECDDIILVTAPQDIRVQRVMQRDNVTREEVLSRMDNQWDDQKKAALSSYIINNINLNDAKKKADEIFKLLKDW